MFCSLRLPCLHRLLRSVFARMLCLHQKVFVTVRKEKQREIARCHTHTPAQDRPINEGFLTYPTQHKSLV